VALAVNGSHCWAGMSEITRIIPPPNILLVSQPNLPKKSFQHMTALYDDRKVFSDYPVNLLKTLVFQVFVQAQGGVACLSY
jgi:hypothetical protein